MFKYIANILAQFTKAQKIWALIILVLTIIVISLGTTYLKTTNQSCTELQSQLEAQRNMIDYQQSDINQLQKTVRELNQQLIHNNTECTDSTLALQEYYNKKLMDQQRYVAQTIEQVRMLLSTSKPDAVQVHAMVRYENDSTVPQAVAAPIIQVDDNKNLNTAIKMLDNLKKKIKAK